MEGFQKEGYINYGKYFRIYEDIIEGRKTPIYHLYNHDIERVFLGDIKWNGAWRKYCFYPNPDTLWDTQCLQCVISFIEDLMAERRK